MSGFDLPPIEMPPPRLLGAPATDQPAVGAARGERGFSAALVDALTEVDQLADESNAKAAALARGEPVDVHELMVAMGKSDVAFSLMLEVRNKLVEAWERLAQSVT